LIADGMIIDRTLIITTITSQVIGPEMSVVEWLSFAPEQEW